MSQQKMTELSQRKRKPSNRKLKTKKINLTQVNWHICFIAERILFYKLLQVLLKAAESRTKVAWEPHAALRTAVEKHWSR